MTTNWTGELETLQAEQADLNGRLHLARTMKPRQELLTLENEVNADRLRVKELRQLAYDTSVKNRCEIDRLKLETARLINESISLDNEAVMVELTLRPRQQEINELRKQIEADKNSV
jgi:predicted  nucleic acid-binding Zn-ribbon protein